MTVRQTPGAPDGPRLVYHSCYATVLKAVDARYDVRGYILAQMVRVCLENRGRVPLTQRAHYERYAQKEAIAFTELFTASLLFGAAGRFSPYEYLYSKPTLERE